ncbi:MAG: PQQ-binding-like beta-propeller repeat protein [Sulfurimonas sp.]|nr:PQQ-binding-like beta-propeller repeat protein [Sulfurimonas sp.]MBU3937886.1 PQQ-binding-like beta-propeller repeat protein [bacterium]MBU4025345.1 PQQ-binding-like beta-propeller repeat protein [bacterium]MBU4058457.1 PQQ-binding-like beta-propeller repeat protein [bacterium]MBU4111199.1 PQQ-binding-like beta-propeller repeat protein [bacterium]
MIKSALKTILSLLFVCTPYLEADALFSQNYPCGGFLEGDYDTNASSPTPYNTTRTYPYEGPSGKPSIFWQYRGSPSAIKTAPAISRDEIIYFGSNDSYLYALDIFGKLKWKFKAKGAIHSSPIIREDESILFGSSDSNLYALDKNGTLLWKFDAKGRIDATPVLDQEGNIYFGAKNSFFYALNKNGKLLWKINLSAPILGACAIDATGYIYVGNQLGTLFSLNSHGKIRWRYKTKNLIKSAPAIDREGTVYVSSTDWSLYALDTQGKLKYSYKTAWHITATPVLGFDNTLYVGSWDWNMHALSTLDGSQRWKTNIGYYATYISGDALLDSRGILYVGSRNDYFYAFDKDGAILWGVGLQGDVLGAPALSKSGLLLVATDKGYIYALK